MEKFLYIATWSYIMNDKNMLLDNIEKIHTTELGMKRISNNLELDIADIINYCKSLLLNDKCRIYKKGKNFYCECADVLLTINSYSYTIITAHKIKR